MQGLRQRRASSVQVRSNVVRGATWLILLGWGAFAVLPVIWLLLGVTKTGTELVTAPPFSFGSWGNVARAWENVYDFQNGVVIQWILNTVILTGATLVLTIVVTIPAGYALGALQFGLRKPILVATLGLMLLPGSSLVLPLFLEMSQIGLVGNRLAVILPLSVFPLGLYLTFIYFSTTLGRDIYDAARIDGCSEWRLFLSIGVPLAKPIVTLVTFFCFMRAWSDFLLPFVMLGSAKYPLPVGVTVIARQAPELNPIVSESTVGIPEVLLVVVLTMVPVVVAISVAQRILLRSADILGGGLRG